MKNILILFLLTIALASCENLLIKDLEIEETGFEKQLVVQSFIGAGTDSVGVLVSENISVLENADDIVYVEGADVRLLREGNEIAVLTQAQDGFYSGRTSEVLGPADNYEILVSNTPYADARGLTRIPEDANLSDLEFTFDAGTDPLEMSEISEISFTIDDPLGKNYYSVGFPPVSLGLDTFIFGLDTIVEENFAYVYPVTTQLDPSVSTSQFLDDFVIDDTAFEGQKARIRLRVSFSYWTSSPGFGDDIEKQLQFRITSHSTDSYNFLTSYSAYQQSRDFALFTEPVSVYTNIENGLGVFAGSSSKDYKFVE